MSIQYVIQIYTSVIKRETDYQIIYTCYYENLYYDTTDIILYQSCPLYASIYACGYAAKALRINNQRGQIFYTNEDLYKALKGLHFNFPYNKELDRLFYYELSKSIKFSYGTRKENWLYEKHIIGKNSLLAKQANKDTKSTKKRKQSRQKSGIKA